MRTSRMFAVADTPTVKVAGVSADKLPAGGVMVTPVRGLSATATVAVLPATFAVTVIFGGVPMPVVLVSATLATPDESVFAVPVERLPTSVVNVTGIRPRPRRSRPRRVPESATCRPMLQGSPATR